MEVGNLIDNKECNRYEYKIGELYPHIEYRIKENDIYLIHTEIPESLQRKGIGTRLVEDVLKEVEAKGYKLIPLCSFVAGYIKRHPSWARLLKEVLSIG